MGRFPTGSKSRHALAIGAYSPVRVGVLPSARICLFRSVGRFVRSLLAGRDGELQTIFGRR
ncbi:MAG TPA: hypothetical protein DCG16_06335, partial [Gemmatimonadetes bacterium]|nr:hypothetical protein [Gemmatimonadota bacterium]